MEKGRASKFFLSALNLGISQLLANEIHTEWTAFTMFFLFCDQDSSVKKKHSCKHAAIIIVRKNSCKCHV